MWVCWVHMLSYQPTCWQCCAGPSIDLILYISHCFCIIHVVCLLHVAQAGLSIERNRVRTKNSSLAMTRTLGDTKYKQPDLPPAKQVRCYIPMAVVCRSVWDVRAAEQLILLTKKCVRRCSCSVIGQVFWLRCAVVSDLVVACARDSAQG